MRSTLIAGVVLALCATAAPAQAHVNSGNCSLAIATQVAKEVGLQTFVSHSINDIVADVNAWLEDRHPSAKPVSRQIVVSSWTDSINLHAEFMKSVEYHVYGDSVDYVVPGHVGIWFEDVTREAIATEKELLSIHNPLPLATLEGTLPSLMSHDFGTYMEPYDYDPWVISQKIDAAMEGIFITAWSTKPREAYEWILASAIAERRASLHRLIMQRDEAREATIANCES